jgi:hypothetical protein
MSQIYSNIVPENNLRLPDALTVRHGPAQLLARFVLAGHIAARQRGVDLRLRHDFAEFDFLAKRNAARDKLLRPTDIFNPDYAELTADNAFWLAGEDEHGEIVLLYAGRVYSWTDTTLAQEARGLFYGGRDVGQGCRMTPQAAEIARTIRGQVLYTGAGWIRADYRQRQLSRLFPRLGKAYAFARWPLDVNFGFVQAPLVAKAVATGFGYREELQTRSIFFTDSPWGDIEVALVRLLPTEAYEDFASFFAAELTGVASDKTPLPPWETTFEDIVTNISSDRVLQGSSSRS